jgi:hypothetical protein
LLTDRDVADIGYTKLVLEPCEEESFLAYLSLYQDDELDGESFFLSKETAYKLYKYLGGLIGRKEYF